MKQKKDDKLWRLAKKRADFIQNIYSYVFVNIILWIIWWFTKGRSGNNLRFPWPLWVMLIWGVEVLLHYFEAYKNGDKSSLANEEYEKLKRSISEEERDI